MSTTPDVAFAVPFAWTPGAYDLRLAFASGASPVDVTLAAGTYRISLGSSTTDALRALETAINAALGVASRTETATVTISALGRVSLSLSAACDWTLTATLAATLGISATSHPATATVLGSTTPRDLYLCAGGPSEGWQRREPIAGAMTAGGRAYAIRSGIVSDRDEVELQFIPSTETDRTLADEVWTSWEGWERFFTTALAQTVAFTRFWRSVRTSTEPFDLVTIPPDALAAPRVRYQFPGLTMWRTWRLPMVRTGTETR